MAKNSLIIDNLARKYDISTTLSQDLIKEIFNFITEKLEKNLRTELRYFGSFSIRRKKNNLNWKNKYNLCNQGSYNIVYFKPSIKLYQRLNNGCWNNKRDK